MIPISQYDTDVVLIFDLYASRGNLQIESGTVATLYGKRKDGTEITIRGTLSGHTVTINVPEDLTLCAGTMICEVNLAHGGKDLSTENFFLMVEPAARDHSTPLQTFVNFWNGVALIYSVDLQEGQDAEYTGETPAREEDDRHLYEFNGWSLADDDNTPDLGALINVVEGRNVYACFIDHTKTYLSFYNGETLLPPVLTIFDGGDGEYTGETPTRESTETNTFTFSGWSLFDDNRANVNALKAITADRKVYAAYAITGPTFTVNFYHDSSLLQSSIVPQGGDAHFSPDPPRKLDNPRYDYDFTGWSLTDNDNEPDEGAINNVTEDRTLYACFVVTHFRPMIYFYYDAEKVYEALLHYGDTAVYRGPELTKESTKYEDYEFGGWSLENDNTVDANALVNITEDTNVYACFIVTHRRAYITFWDEGQQIVTYTITDGGDAVYEEAEPEKDSDTHYDYAFNGWSKDTDDNTPEEDALNAVTSDRNVYACFKVIKTRAWIRYYNGNEMIRERMLEDGASDDYDGTPRRESTAHEDYTFSGWSIGSDDNIVDDGAQQDVWTDRNLYACYSIRYHYTVVFFNGSTRLRSQEVYDFGNATYEGITPTKASTNQYDYEFSGWSKDSDDGTVDSGALTNVRANRNVYACFRVSQERGYIIFCNYDGTELSNGWFNVGTYATYKGSTPTKPSTDRYDYAFTGWDNLYVSSGTKKVYAQFTVSQTRYYVTFVNEGVTLGTTLVASGGTASYSGSTPTKKASDRYSYGFSGWSRSSSGSASSSALTNITADTTVYARFVVTETRWKVDWVYRAQEPKNIMQTTWVPTGGTAVYPGPTPTSSIGTFWGWSQNGNAFEPDDHACDNITQDTRIYAVFIN